MANTNEIYQALSGFGFAPAGRVCCGAWKGYAVALWPFTNNVYYVGVAVRLPKIPGGLKKALGNALKDVKEPGLKLAGIEMIKKNEVVASISFAKAEDPARYFAAWMDRLTAALRENGVDPADTSILTGAARPDSLCLVSVEKLPSYQPVCAAEVREIDARTHEKAEENQANGSYATGFLGALLGMLVGLVPNILTIVASERIYSLLFALVPLCAMFGYKLFKGKLSKGAIAIVIVLCLVGVLLIPIVQMTMAFVHEYGFSVGEALPVAAGLMVDPEFLTDPDVTGELLQLLLFMALGVWIAWRYMFSQINSTAVRNSEAQTATLRPNPNYAPAEAEVYSAE